MGSNSIQKDVCFDVPTLCEDVLVEILCRLPEEDLIRYKCVSKDWYFIIAETCVPIVSANTPLCGLYFRTAVISDDMSRVNLISPNAEKLRYVKELKMSSDKHVMDYVSLESRNRDSRMVDKPDPLAKNFLDSCNGLLLFKKPSTCHYYVCNPTTKESMAIPCYFCNYHDHRNQRVNSALAFDPCKSLHFKIICFPRLKFTDAKNFWLDTFSSETGNWVRRTMQYDFDHLQTKGRTLYGRFVYLDGMLYRLLTSYKVLSIDLNLASAHIINNPENTKSLYPASIGVSMGHLCYTMQGSRYFSVWLLDDDDRNKADGWILKFKIKFFDLLSSLSLQFELDLELLWIVAYAIHPKSDVIFLGTPRRIISWHIKSNRLIMLYKTEDLNTAIPGNFTPVLPYHRCLVPLKPVLGMRNCRSNQLVVNFEGTKVQSD